MESWQEQHGTYRELHRGADGGTSDPHGDQKRVGSQRPPEGFEAKKRALEHGRAASHPVEIQGVSYNDAGHHPALSGHLHAQNANMFDSQFAENTAATSDYSFHTNALHYATLSSAAGLPMGYTQPNPSGPAQAHLAGLKSGGYSSVSELFEKRASRLLGQEGGELMIKGPAEKAPMTLTSLLTRDWTGTELGVAGLASYAAFSVLAR